MECPICNTTIHPGWKPFTHDKLPYGNEYEFSVTRRGAKRHSNDMIRTQLAWMLCPSCEQVLIIVSQGATQWDVSSSGGGSILLLVGDKETWFAVPRRPAIKPLPKVVGEPWRTDYEEGLSIVDLSTRMSALLARAMLEQLLATYAGCNQFNLKDKIAAFVASPDHPQRIKSIVDAVRKLANLAAHPKVSGATGEIIPITEEEARSLFGIIERLIDYFIVEPAADSELMKGIAKKVAEAEQAPE